LPDAVFQDTGKTILRERGHTAQKNYMKEKQLFHGRDEVTNAWPTGTTICN
jgi:hypothetical protein